MTDINPTMDYFDGNHICLSVLTKAQASMKEDDKIEISDIATQIIDASLRAFETSLLAFVRGVFIGRSSAGHAETGEDDMVDIIGNCVCSDCFITWFTLREKCCVGHAVRELIESITLDDENFSVVSVPVSHTQHPELN